MNIQIPQINSFCGQVNKNLARHIELLQSSPTDSITVFPYNTLAGYPPESNIEYTSFIHRFDDIISELNQTRKPYITTLPYCSQGKIEFCLHSSHSELPHPPMPRKGIYVLQRTPQYIIGGLFREISHVTFPETEHPHVALLFDDEPFHIEKSTNQENALQHFIAEYRPDCTILIRRVGGEGGLVFEGNSKVYNSQGALCATAPYFEENIFSINTDRLQTIPFTPPHRIALMHDAIVMGIRDYFHKNNIGKAFLGLSGGIDSALVVALAVKALGKENVEGVLLPSAVSSDHSVSDAEKSAQNLGIRYHIVPIEPIFQSLSKNLEPLFQSLPTDTTEENMQARIRGVILMAISNKFRGALLNTSNKSESAVGYGTLYGDMCGGLAPIADIYKTDVWAMARYINRAEEIIPEHSITKAPSAELRPGQKDSDSLPDYAVLDKLLYDHLENCLSEKQLLEKGHDPELIKRVLHLLKINEWKRRQAAPPIKIARRTFGHEILFPIA